MKSKRTNFQRDIPFCVHGTGSLILQGGFDVYDSAPTGHRVGLIGLFVRRVFRTPNGT